MSLNWMKWTSSVLFVLLLWCSWVGQADASALAENVILLDGEIEATQLTTHLGESVGFVISVQNNGDVDAEGVLLHVALPDSVNFLTQNRGWVKRINTDSAYAYLKPMGPLAANTSHEVVLILQVKHDLPENITTISAPSIKITADDVELFQLEMGTGDDVLIINEVTALGDSTETPTSLPTEQEPTRTLQELRVYLPLIY